MLDEPFLGSTAVAAGWVTPAQLRGSRFTRLFHGIFVRADTEVDFAVRARAAALVNEGRGVVVGWSARTAFDLARRRPLVHAIIGVDALRYARGVEVETVRSLAHRHLGVRGIGQVPEVLRRSTWLAQSPMETRLRIAIEDGGLPPPVLQHRVGLYVLDLAYPEYEIAIEYDGRDHLTPERARRDLARQAYLTGAGWKVVRFSAAVVLHERWKIASDVRTLMRTR